MKKTVSVLMMLLMLIASFNIASAQRISCQEAGVHPCKDLPHRINKNTVRVGETFTLSATQGYTVLNNLSPVYVIQSSLDEERRKDRTEMFSGYTLPRRLGLLGDFSNYQYYDEDGNPIDDFPGSGIVFTRVWTLEALEPGQVDFIFSYYHFESGVTFYNVETVTILSSKKDLPMGQIARILGIGTRTGPVGELIEDANVSEKDS